MSELNQIQRSTFIRAPRSRVWRALSDIAEFCRWFSCQTSAAAFEPGVPIVMSSTYPGEHYGVTFTVHIEEIVPQQTLSWRWHPNALDPAVDLSREPATLVTFQLEDAEGGTHVTVTESGFDKLFEHRRKATFEGNDLGWKIQLAALERYAGETH